MEWTLNVGEVSEFFLVCNVVGSRIGTSGNIGETGSESMANMSMGSLTRLRNTPISRIWSAFLETCLSTFNGWNRSSSRTLTFAACLSIILTLSAPCPAAFAEIPTEIAIKILIGEAVGKGPVGMQAVGEVLRRKKPSAFSTLRRKDLDLFIARQAAWYKAVKKQDLHELALTAWKKSEKSNLTKGATLYENLEAFGFPKSWDPRKVKKVAYVAGHTFFIEVKPSQKKR